MKILIFPLLLIASLIGKSQIKLDSIFYQTVQPDTVLLQEGIIAKYNNWKPDVLEIDPAFMADFAEWSLSHFTPRRCCCGRYWLRRHSSNKKQFMDKDIFELFNQQRKKPKTR